MKSLLGVNTQGYSASTTDDEARAAFRRKFGYEPLDIHRNAGAVLAVPIPASTGAGDDSPSPAGAGATPAFSSFVKPAGGGVGSRRPRLGESRE